jgi:xylulokinase
MQRDSVIGVDIGTQGTRAAVFGLGGELLAEASEPSVLVRPAPGAVEEDPERQYASVCRSVRACLEKGSIDAGRVAAIAIDGQMAGVIGIGADGRAVTPYDSWLDTRCAEQIALMRETAGDRVLALTGNEPSYNHGPKILWWKSRRPEAWKRIVSFVQPGGYAAMRLCGSGGSQAFIDDSYLHFSGFADNAKRRWDEGLLRTFGVPESKMPRIAFPSDIVGKVSAAASAESGLLEGTPVAAGLGDTAASFLACGAVAPGLCVDVAGSASVFAATVSDFAPDLRARVMGCGRSAVEGLWHPYAYVNGGGLNLNWFVESLLGEADVAAALARLGDAIRDIEPRIDDPYFVPHMEGRVTPSDPSLRGAWAGVTRAHGAASLYRAILEGVALEYAIYRDAVRALNPSFGLVELRVTGGGARESSWNRMKADVLGLGVVALEGGGGAPMGAALVAGAACGALSDLVSAASAWTKPASRIDPDPRRGAVYAARLPGYERLLGALSGFPGINGGTSR